MVVLWRSDYFSNHFTGLILAVFTEHHTLLITGEAGGREAGGRSFCFLGKQGDVLFASFAIKGYNKENLKGVRCDNRWQDKQGNDVRAGFITS